MAELGLELSHSLLAGSIEAIIWRAGKVDIDASVFLALFNISDMIGACACFEFCSAGTINVAKPSVGCLEGINGKSCFTVLE